MDYVAGGYSVVCMASIASCDDSYDPDFTRSWI